MQNKKDLLFFIPYCLYLICRLIETSTFQSIFEITDLINLIVRVIMVSFIGIKLILEFKDCKQYAYIYIPTFAVFLLAAYFSKHGILLDTFVIVIGAWNIELKKIVKVFACVATAVYVVVFIFSQAKVIEDVLFISNDFTYWRHSFGAISPTDFGAMIFYLQIAWAFLQKKSYGFAQLVLWILIDGFIYTFCHARLNVVLIALFTIVWFCKDRVNINKKVKDVFFILPIPICFVGSLIMHYFYCDNQIMVKLNTLLSGRLALGKNALETYGLKLFGSDFEMFGIGWSLKPQGEYNFIDCGYLYVGIQYGILILTIILIAYMLVVRNETKNNRYELPIVIAFIALSSVVDHHIFQMAYNVFLFTLPLAISYFPMSKLIKNKAEENND